MKNGVLKKVYNKEEKKAHSITVQPSEIIASLSTIMNLYVGCYDGSFVVYLLLCILSLAIVRHVECDDHDLCFPVVGDIGGMPKFPFQTTAQRKVAKLLAKVRRFVCLNSISFKHYVVVIREIQTYCLLPNMQ